MKAGKQGISLDSVRIHLWHLSQVSTGTIILVIFGLYTGTQEAQDKEDEGARKKAMKELVQSWMDRLQLISVLVCDFLSSPSSCNTILQLSNSLYTQS